MSSVSGIVNQRSKYEHINITKEVSKVFRLQRAKESDLFEHSEVIKKTFNRHKASKAGKNGSETIFIEALPIVLPCTIGYLK